MIYLETYAKELRAAVGETPSGAGQIQGETFRRMRCLRYTNNSSSEVIAIRYVKDGCLTKGLTVGLFIRNTLNLTEKNQ